MIKRYSIPDLLSLRRRASKPPGLEAALEIIDKIQAEAKEYGNPRRSRDTNRRQYAGQRPSRRQHHGPAIQATKMPLKTSKSEVVLLLNKLGGDNVKVIAEQMEAIYKNASEPGELVTWIHAKTIKQHELAEVFCQMWLHMFRRDTALRSLYLRLCREYFQRLSYESSEDPDDEILALCHTMMALQGARIVGAGPVTEVVWALVSKLVCNARGCAQGLAVLVAGRNTDMLQSAVKRTRDPKGLLIHMFSTVNKDAYCLTVYPIVCAQASVALLPSELEETLTGLLFSELDPPTPMQIKLLLDMDDSSPIPGFVGKLAQHLVNQLAVQPELVEAVLPIFQRRWRRMPSATIKAMDQASERYASLPTASMRLKFKFMDYKDLFKSSKLR